MPVTIALDFDRVIHDVDNPVKGRRMGGPMPGAIEGMDALVDAGFNLVIYTNRATNQAAIRHIVDWLDYYGAPPCAVTITKPDAAIYVDDRALQHLDWSSTVTEVYKRLDIEPD